MKMIETGLPSRRIFLRRFLLTVALSLLPTLFRTSPARAALPPLPNLPKNEALLLTPADKRFWRYSAAYNRRTMVQPKLRAVCKTPTSVSAMVNWLRSHQLPFAVRSGGHSFEGLSQSHSIVVDLRKLDGIKIDIARKTVSVGAGASLGALYRVLSHSGYALPAGSCLTVGVAGHALGGGYGFLSRKYGLLCDSLHSLKLVAPDGRMVEVDAKENSDLFWASRGGGGGSFGIVTQLNFEIFRLDRLLVFSMQWILPSQRALDVVAAWQAWAPHAPDTITAELRISKPKGGKLKLVCDGQSVGSENELKRELTPILDSAAPEAKPILRRMSFLQATEYFSDGWEYESYYSKDKSDFVFLPLDGNAIATLLGELQRLPGDSPLTVTFSPFGGRIAILGPQDSAFPHRKALCCLHYEVTWKRAVMTSRMLTQMHTVYTKMRPYMSGAAYVNYCDKELSNWRQAYWGSNLPRLESIKARFDPENVFRHDQSI
jgi:FAD/FMN-containing dehydrogenase